jgi:hypothetical protein
VALNTFNRLRRVHHRCARTICRNTIAYTIRHLLSSASLYKRLAIEPFDTYYNLRLLRWTGHVARIPFIWALRKILICWGNNPRPLGCPEMNRGKKKTNEENDLSIEFAKWRGISADRNQRRALFGSKISCATKAPFSAPISLVRSFGSRGQDTKIWTELRYGTVS